MRMGMFSKELADLVWACNNGIILMYLTQSKFYEADWEANCCSGAISGAIRPERAGAGGVLFHGLRSPIHC
jgi:hypothetical protein